ncbi:hypothetical protein [Streptomyces sp. NPDC058193]|uniref:hypothetical protein n=1 Tax=Streptomyces sp. NPDC058193 TaxID=3346373 RepID=UPI0036E6E9DE
MEGKKCAPLPPPSHRETETTKGEKKGLSFAAGSFALNLWRTVRDWLADNE